MGEIAPERASLPPVGSVLAGRYTLEKKLAEGGMGAVYQGLDATDGTRIAIKVLHPEFSSDPAIVRRFRRESSVLAALAHPSIVTVIDTGTDNHGRCFTVMELLVGETLLARMTRLGVIPARDLVWIVDAVCSALGAAHTHGVVHGDVKPANVFLTGKASAPGPSLKLVDFGLSKIYGLDRLTRTGEVIGTPRYMAPELLTGEAEPDGRVDVYAMGVMLYEALSGRNPFVERNPGRLLLDIVGGKLVPLRTVTPTVTVDVALVVERALAARRDSRFATPVDLAVAYAAACGV